MYFDDMIIEYLVSPNKWNFLNQSDPKITATQIKESFIAFLIISGYNTLSSKRMHWKSKDDKKRMGWQLYEFDTVFTVTKISPFIDNTKMDSRLFRYYMEDSSSKGKIK